MMLGTSLPLALDWWLPPDYARGGVGIDALFVQFLVITGVVLLVVQGLLVWVMVRYRRGRTGRGVWFTHGSRRIEVIWTAVPLVLLLGMAAMSTRVWDGFRYSAEASDPGRAKILIIGEQFRWNIVYPGPDGMFGRYLIYPKVTDALWPVGPDGRAIRFAGVAGPSELPRDQAAAAVERYIAVVNPLGKDFSDPAGRDDDYRAAAVRPLYLPVNRAVELEVMSKDVIHDLYLPNFRVQIYAVPGEVGKVVFTPTVTSAELAARGEPGEVEFACAQLCGVGHSVMRGTVVVLTGEEYDARFGKSE